MEKQPMLFDTPVLLQPETTPGGFLYKENFITLEEEQELLQIFQTLPFHHATHQGYEAQRRVIGYGWDSRPELPAFLKPLRNRAAAFVGLEPEKVNTALLSEYSPGTPIGWHRDKPTIGHVIGISLGAPCRFRLRKVNYNVPPQKWERFTVTAEPRSIYCMREESRRDWQHSIVPVEALRYSITLRDF